MKIFFSRRRRPTVFLWDLDSDVGPFGLGGLFEVSSWWQFSRSLWVATVKVGGGCKAGVLAGAINSGWVRKLTTSQ